MSSWARRAADIGSVVTSCGHPGSSAPAYPYRLEKVKFGVPLDEVCKNDIPGPLLVLILKLNKESPNRRDVFRAPGHQGAMKKLIHFLQTGRLVNVDNYSVYTIASVLKKFLRKIPNGIFGRSGEKELFEIIELQNESEQNERLHRLFTSLPRYTQHLLVLLFGTFRVIASNAAHAGTGMTSEALGVSVAPSFFQSCVSDGKTARMEDVLKFKVATKIMKHIIDKFAAHDLFGRDNYEYYARVTGRILKVQDEWICSFQYPQPPRGKVAQQKYALQHSLEAEKTWLQCQCERWGLLAQEESRSTPALLTSSSSALDNSVLSLGVTPEHSFIESCARLSVSLEGPGLFALTSSPIPKRNDEADDAHYADNDDDDEDGEDEDDGDDENDFAAELEISNDDDDIENNPTRYLLPSNNGNNNTHNRRAPPSATRGGRRQMRNAATNVALSSDVVDLPPDHVVDDDDDDDDEDEAVVVKRRYRQNKKKILTQTRMQQHQRRLRAGTKSLDTGERVPGNELNAKNGTKNGHGKGGGGLTTMVSTTTTTRTCSRCNRGIRHSSSCSSASGGGGGSGAAAAGNGSGMTMEELRAVNRYAESTKSLSYLPQLANSPQLSEVHERQTARMRTRSEWFLGPRDSVVTLQLPNTCSNCCLAVAQQQQQHYQQHSYLGGGSTRDMRTQRSSDYEDNNDGGAGIGVGGGVVSGGSHLRVDRDHHHNVTTAHHDNAFYVYYKKRLQQQQQQEMQHHQRQLAQNLLQPEHMDTDESIDYDNTQQIHSTGAFFNAQQQQQQQKTTRATGGGERGGAASAAPAVIGSGRRMMYLDTNTVGNIRLSNSAESVQYTAASSGSGTRRPTSRRFIGVNVPRQYPLRTSLRRHKEKQIGSNGNNSTGGSGSNLGDSNNTLATPAAAMMLPASNAPPSVRNSIAECCGNIAGLHASQHILTPTFPYNRLETRANSLEHNKQQLRAYIDAEDAADNNMYLQLTGAATAACGGDNEGGGGGMVGSGLLKQRETHGGGGGGLMMSHSGSNLLIYTTATISSISPVLSTRNLENVVSGEKQQQQHPQDELIEGVSTITFKAPRV